MSTTPLPHRALRFPLAPHHNAFVCSHHPCVPPPRSHRATSSSHSSRFHHHHDHPRIIHPLSATTATDATDTTTLAPPDPHRCPSSTIPLYGQTVSPLRAPRSARPPTNSQHPCLPSVPVAAPPCSTLTTSVPAHDVLPAATLPRPFRHELSVELSWRRGQKCRDAFGSVCAQRRKGDTHAQRTCL